jgi:hypothetical protein
VNWWFSHELELSAYIQYEKWLAPILADCANQLDVLDGSHVLASVLDLVSAQLPSTLTRKASVSWISSALFLSLFSAIRGPTK